MVLQITALTLEGRHKLDVLSGTVRVFNIVAGSEVNLLAPTSLSNIVVPSPTGVWRYIWTNPPLPSAGQYIIEYVLTDADGVMGIATEDLFVEDDLVEDATVLSRLTNMEASMGTLLDVGLGRQRLQTVDQTWRLFRRDGTPLVTFDTKDDLGNPSAQDIFERIPRP